MNTNTKDLNSKKVLVVGLGTSGQAASKLLLSKGASLWVTENNDNPKTRQTANDLTKKGAIVELGRHTEDLVKGKDFIVISPGVNSRHETVKWAGKHAVPVISELEFASWFVDCPLICVTGTNGKSTVTSLIDHILKNAGKKSVACGNLGVPLSDVVLNYKRLDFAVVEASSFQLEYIKNFKPYIGIWLNFSYDHLDHHASMDEYLKAKLRIFENQTEGDWAVVHYEELERVGNVKSKKIMFGGEDDSITGFSNALMKGQHNYENILASVIAARICGIGNDIIKISVRDFKPLPHRMEYVASIGNIHFMDDSKATNVHAVIPAVNSLLKPIALILGGRDKGDDFSRLKEIIKKKIAFIVAIGEAREKIIKQLNGIVPIYRSSTMEDAVNCAYKNSASGTTVMLSPGCSSFDMFRDYKERGERFQEAVRDLKNRTERYNDESAGPVVDTQTDRMFCAI